MFWNPATMTQMPGMQSESVLSGIMPYAANTPDAGTLHPFGLAAPAIPPRAHWCRPPIIPGSSRPDMWLGMSVNSPFGLSVGFPDTWAGREYAAGSSQPEDL